MGKGILAGLALLATLAPAARAGERTLFEPFNHTYSARTFHQPKEGVRRGTLWIGGDYQNSSLPRGFGGFDIDQELYRGGIGYAQERWQVGASVGNLHTDADGPFGGSDNHFTWDVHLKGNFWSSRSGRTNLAAVFSYRDYTGLASRVDGLLAAEHRFGSDLSAVVNLGYGRTDYDFADTPDGFVGSVGLLWHPARWRRLTLGVDYTFPNEVDVLSGNSFDEYDNWSVKAGYFLTDAVQLTAGGGKRQLFFLGLSARIR